jgi:hypothetical protein
MKKISYAAQMSCCALGDFTEVETTEKKETKEI